MPPDIWAYRAQLVKVIDGDTLQVVIDAGLNCYRTERLRLLGVNTPEKRGPTHGAGLLAQGYVEEWLEDAEGEWPLVIVTQKSDAFGRYLARVWRSDDGACLNDDLLAAGHAVVFRAE